MTKKVDRKISGTRKMLRESLTSLMQQKPVQSITVREITELADTNRSTFCLHYQDVYDMVNQIQEDMFREFNEIMMVIPDAPSDQDLFLLSAEIFSVIKNNADFAIVLLGKNGNTAFVGRLKDLVKRRTLGDWSGIIQSDDRQKADYFYAFVITGYIGVIERWLKNGLREIPIQMAEITRGLIVQGASLYKTE